MRRDTKHQSTAMCTHNTTRNKNGNQSVLLNRNRKRLRKMKILTIDVMYEELNMSTVSALVVCIIRLFHKTDKLSSSITIFTHSVQPRQNNSAT